MLAHLPQPLASSKTGLCVSAYLPRTGCAASVIPPTALVRGSACANRASFCMPAPVHLSVSSISTLRLLHCLWSISATSRVFVRASICQRVRRCAVLPHPFMFRLIMFAVSAVHSSLGGCVCQRSCPFAVVSSCVVLGMLAHLPSNGAKSASPRIADAACFFPLWPDTFNVLGL